MYILGINSGHTATAALLKNGKILGCVSEERFTGIKNQTGFPKKSIKWLLSSFHLSPKDITAVGTIYKYSVIAYSENDPKAYHALNIIYQCGIYGRKVLRSMENTFSFLRPINWFFYKKVASFLGKRGVTMQNILTAKYTKIPLRKIHNIDHHTTHAYSAYYSSPYNKEDALVLTLDGEGDLLCATVSVVQNGEWKRIAETQSDNSLGWIFQEITRYLGMRPLEHEYKVMGLAPYAKDKDVANLYNNIKDLIVLDPKNPLRFKGIIDLHGVYNSYFKKKLNGQRFDVIAGAFQKLVEERICEWVYNAVETTNIQTVVAAGGVFMNVKANKKIAELPNVKKLFIPPSCGDELAAIGACYYIDQVLLPKKSTIPPIKTIYWGPSFSTNQIISILKEKGFHKKYHVERIMDIEKTIARLLVEGHVVARMAGKMEFGARALGNRSILANPKDYSVVKEINEQVKSRDFWMPFAPTILRERMEDYCINPKNLYSPYMLLSFDATDRAKKEICAALHPYDATLRPQILEESWNPAFYKIIKEFETLTGIGAVLNTSFNLHGFPIVLGQKEAMYAFENSGLRFLAMENVLIRKN